MFACPLLRKVGFLVSQFYYWFSTTLGFQNYQWKVHFCLIVLALTFIGFSFCWLLLKFVCLAKDGQQTYYGFIVACHKTCLKSNEISMYHVWIHYCQVLGFWVLKLQTWSTGNDGDSEKKHENCLLWICIWGVICLESFG